jgi:hypothetical protein
LENSLCPQRSLVQLVGEHRDRSRLDQRFPQLRELDSHRISPETREGGERGGGGVR